jgi:branched-chain amino acid aminotransferase
VEEGRFSRQDIYGADAAFFCGTAAEVIGLQSLDDRPFTMPWEETNSRLVQSAYKNLVVENKTELIKEITGIE